ncbi:MAG: response regulator [Kineosporiaceae bacterium]
MSRETREPATAAAAPQPAVAVPAPRPAPSPPSVPVAPGPGSQAGSQAADTADLGVEGARILVVDDDEMVRELLRAILEEHGMTVVTAADGAAGIEALRAVHPDLVVSDITMPGVDGFDFVRAVRAQAHGHDVPFLFLTSRTDPADAAEGLRLGADDYVRKPVDLDELVARVTAKLLRRPVSAQALPTDSRTGLLRGARFVEELARESARAERAGRGGAVAVVDLDERAFVRRRLGARAEADLVTALSPLVGTGLGALELLGIDDDGRFLVLLPEVDADDVAPALHALARRLASTTAEVSGERIDVTPVVGWTTFGAGSTGQGLGARDLLRRATAAAHAASGHLDLQPVRWSAELEAETDVPAPGERAGRLRRRLEALRLPTQILGTVVIGVVAPFVLYVACYNAGFDISTGVYVAVVVALAITAGSIWTEGFLALDPLRPPDEPASDWPRASAVIAAYLPNEAATVVETVHSFLRVDYPDLQVVLAYNCPRPMPVEATLARIAAADPRFVPLRVEGSTSKAQNVNAALAHVDGEFVGVFDADHHPAPDAFRRAWRWLSNGWDVVQGHCVVRNGDASWVARTVAVEFEAIYAVSHPGRAKLHGFGVFGGSNGYWRTDRLRGTRMHGFMLTEDIDSSLRVVQDGGRIANDPGLISRELAPTTVRQLWNQRMRWAQGWFQVSRKHLIPAWRSPHLRLRQRLGMTFLLGWRELYPWVSMQSLPLLAFLGWREGGVANLDWFIALFVLTTLFTASVGPGQVLFARRLAVPEIRRRTRWFWSYLAATTVAYTELKNVIARVAQIKEFSGERVWKVTPRATPTGDEPPGGRA